jgi:hypothetical protein
MNLRWALKGRHWIPPSPLPIDLHLALLSIFASYINELYAKNFKYKNEDNFTLII